MTQGDQLNSVILTPEAAAAALFDDPSLPVDFEPGDELQARRAIETFRRLFEEAPGVFKEALDGARAGAETLSVDRLQGLAELLQNADDAGASAVQFQLFSDRLVASHDGHAVQLKDVLALATPWVSNKGHDPGSTGRFGIGLMTLRALSESLEVHSGPYHLALGEPSLSAISPDTSVGSAADGDTMFVVPLTAGQLTLDELDAWLARWDDGALLFCRHVERVRMVGADGHEVRVLALKWSAPEAASRTVGGQEVEVLRREARAPDGRRWHVHTADVPSPPGQRKRKAKAKSVPLAVALGSDPASDGLVYAGLPLVPIAAPVRINGPFDPVTSRRDLADTAWNTALLPLILDLWECAVTDLFAATPSVAWHAVPLPPEGEATASRPLGDGMTGRVDAALLEHARHRFADGVRIQVDGASQRLSALAVEAADLEQALSPAEVADLGQAVAALPTAARDSEGRWRLVLADWRKAGANLSDEVTVEDALDLLANSDRQPETTVALIAAALRAGLGRRLVDYRCIVTGDGERIHPPTADSIDAVLAAPSPFAEELGLGHRLARAFLSSTPDAVDVLDWLRQRGALIEGEDVESVVRRLAAAGKAGRRLPGPLSDEQAAALRSAFEALPPDERTALGRHVGAAISLRAFVYDARGRRQETAVRPVDAYLPRAIDREPDSFSVAADKTPGLVWLHGHYTEVLRSPLGRTGGLGAQRFLKLLGAESAPRLEVHGALTERFSSERARGLPSEARGSPLQRGLALRGLGASYTLDDYDSPDLLAVADNIAGEKRARRRRDRASALIAVLGRAWERLSEHEEVTAAQDYYSWQRKGQTKAFWLWAAGAVPWLDDTDGEPKPPLELRLRTAGTVAVHGQDAPGYLRPEFDSPARRTVLAALGVSGEPTTRELVERLHTLRTADTAAKPREHAEADAGVIYSALAARTRTRSLGHGDLSPRDLRKAFADGAGLIRTAHGWRAPTQVLRGPRVFGPLRDFVPQLRDAEPLWEALQVRLPSADDAADVLKQLARKRAEPDGVHAAVHIETLRLLVQTLTTQPPGTNLSRQLAKLPLWTSQGWLIQRPVFAVDDPVLADSLGAHVPVWMPGGELSQFRPLLDALRIRELSVESDCTVEAANSELDEEGTELLRLAVPLLREDLARNEPALSGALTVPWEQLEVFEVRVDPDLSVRVDGEGLGVSVAITARADPTTGELVLSSPEVLPLVDDGGRAIGALFRSDRRRVAQAWLAACVAAEHGRRTRRIQLAEEAAEEEAAHNQQAMADRLADLQDQTATRHKEQTKRKPTAPSRSAGSGQPPPAKPPAPPRHLVDPSKLSVANPEGRPGSGRGARPGGSGGRKTGPLPKPDRAGKPPRSSTPAPSFTALDKETVGLEIVRMVLGGDDQQIVDLRAQHGVGADAIDELDRFFELKVYLNDEPDVIRLEESQIRRALATPDFFLVVVSGIEGTNARPKVRVIVDPVHQLRMTETSAVSFTGVRSAQHSLMYDLVPEEDAE
jgi:hypothetical protein